MSEPGETHTTCPRCGSPSEGSSWCPRCGLNLRAGGTPLSATQPRRESIPIAADRLAGPRGGRRVPVILTVVVLVVLAALGAVVAFFLTRGGKDHVVTVAQTVVQTTSAGSTGVAATESATTSPSGSADARLPLDAIGSLLVEYESAYSNEDVGALLNLFTDDFVRLRGTEPPQDLAEALATYEEQFKELDEPIYELSRVKVTRSSDEAEAAGHYLITDIGRTAGSGRIVFHIVRLGDLLYIDRLDITPSG